MLHYKTTTIGNETYNFLKAEASSCKDIPGRIKKEIETTICSKGLSFRLANLEDIERISTFQKNVFHPHTATLETEYELYRIIKYGYGLLIEDDEKNIKGCYTTIHYSGKEKEGYGIRVGISPEIAGHNFAAKLAKYATVLAFENGCKNFNALMSPTNFRSASNVLNYVGYHCSKFHRNLPSFGTRFEISLPLSLETLNDSEIDMEKVLNFINTREANNDYFLLQPGELDRMENIYATTDFKIIAFLKNGVLDEKDYFFAVSTNTH